MEAEVWVDMLEMRATAYTDAVVTAAVGLAAAGEDAGLDHVDLEGLSTALWSISPEEIAEIISTHREEIARQVANLGKEKHDGRE